MSKKKKTLLIISIIIIILIILITAAVKMLGKAATNAVSTLHEGIPVQELSMQDLSSVIYANGMVESQNKVSITTELTGQIKELYVQLGDYVEAGAPLLIMDDCEIRKKINELEKQLSDQEILDAKQQEINKRSLEYAKQEQAQTLFEAQSAIDQARNQLNQANATMEKAQETYNTYASSEYPETEILQELKAAFTESQIAVTTAQTTLSEAENAYNTAVRSTSQSVQTAQDAIDTQNIGSGKDNTASSTLTELYNQLEKVTITAPQAGIITSLNVSVGSMVTTGDLMVIEDNKNLKISVTIPENDILKISTGMHAVIKANALEDVEMSGTISKVINFASSGSNTTPNMEGMSNGSSGGSYSAEITIDGETKLLLGMNAKAEIILAEKKNALSIAYDSILTEDNGKTYVYLAQENNGEYTVKKVPITIGEEGDYYTEISSEQLKEGDYIVSYPDMVNEGETIKIDLGTSAE